MIEIALVRLRRSKTRSTAKTLRKNALVFVFQPHARTSSSHRQLVTALKIVKSHPTKRADRPFASLFAQLPQREAPERNVQTSTMTNATAALPCEVCELFFSGPDTERRSRTACRTYGLTHKEQSTAHAQSAGCRGPAIPSVFLRWYQRHPSIPLKRCYASDFEPAFVA